MSSLISKNFFAKIIASLMAVTVLLQTTMAYAVVPVPALPAAPDTIPPVPISDAALRTKEVGVTVFGITVPGVTLDGLMIAIVRRLAEEVADNTVDWINGGFSDGPRFAVDLEGTLLDTVDAVAGNVIHSAGFGALCSPFRDQLRIALTTLNANRLDRNADDFRGSCTLSQVSQNIQGLFDGDFIGGGGWDAWFVMTQDPYGNPYSSFLNVQAEIDSRVANAVNLQKEQLQWSRGFLSTQDCAVPSKKDPNLCAEWGDVKTPGILIEGQLQKVFGQEVDQLNLADEFDEILSALVGFLAESVFSDNGIFNNKNIRNRNVTGGSGRQQFGACFANKNSAVVGDNITWTFSGNLNPSDTITWSGEGISGQTTNSVSTTYTTTGYKKASVTVNRVTKVPGQPDIVQPPEIIDCSPTSGVDVAPFAPLEIKSCTVLPKNLRPGGTANWEIEVVGGSGSIRTFQIFDNTTDEGTLEEQKLSETSRRTANGIIINVLIRYLSQGDKTITINVVDAHPLIRPITNYRCADTTFVSP